MCVYVHFIILYTIDIIIIIPFIYIFFFKFHWDSVIASRIEDMVGEVWTVFCARAPVKRNKRREKDE